LKNLKKPRICPSGLIETFRHVYDDKTLKDAADMVDELFVRYGNVNIAEIVRSVKRFEEYRKGKL
jgi:NH3-dependent NAD+ synthetase